VRTGEKRLQLANHEILVLITGRPGHWRARSEPRARLRAIVVSQLKTEPDARSMNRVAVRHAYSNVSATTSSASAASTQDAVGEGVHGSAVTAHQLAQGVRVAAGHTQHNAPVGRGGSLVPHG